MFQKRGCALDVGVRGAFAGKRFHKPRTLCTTFYVVAYSAQAVLTPRAEVSELDSVSLASCTVLAHPAFNVGDKV